MQSGISRLRFLSAVQMADFTTEKLTKRKGLLHRCAKKECGYVEIVDPNPGAVPAAEVASNDKTIVDFHVHVFQIFSKEANLLEGARTRVRTFFGPPHAIAQDLAHRAQTSGVTPSAGNQDTRR